MKNNYVIKVMNNENGEISFDDIDSGIPEHIVNTVESSLKQLDTNFMVTLILVNELTKDLTFGIIEKTDKGLSFKYKVNIIKHIN